MRPPWPPRRLDIRTSGQEISVSLLSDALITRHAVQRMFERDAMTPENYRAKISDALSRAAALACVTTWCDNYNDGSYSFMVEFEDGLLVMNNYPVEIRARSTVESKEVISIRTWLSPEMVADDLARRAINMENAVGRPGEVDIDRFSRVVRDAARPHEYIKKDRAQRQSQGARREPVVA